MKLLLNWNFNASSKSFLFHFVLINLGERLNTIREIVKSEEAWEKSLLFIIADPIVHLE